jgi:hypothetical protein
MLNMNKLSMKTLVVLACCCLLTPVWAADDEKPSGTVQISSKSVAVGVGVTWGNGTLTYNGAPHTFSIDGLSVLDLGISSIHTNGEVFKLKNLADFSGHYVAGAAGIAIVGGVDDVIMRNERGVVLRLHGTEKGVRLQLGAQGVNIEVKN